MTQEDKELLLKDLCARLPYGVKVNFKNVIHTINALFDDGSFWLDDKDDGLIEEIKPYLRLMSSMTEEEYNFVYNGHIQFWNKEDYCNKHHFDYRGLIEKGLALEAPEGMYNIKEK